MNQKVSRQYLARVVTEKLLAEPKRRTEWLRALAAYVVEHKMVEDIDMLVNDIAHELYKQAGVLTVEVTSAQKLSKDVRASLEQFLRDRTDAQQVDIHESVDAELLGGFVARTPDAELDASVQARLRKLAAVA